MTAQPAFALPTGFFELPVGLVAGASRDAVVLVDAQQHIVALNAAAARMFGHARQDMLGWPLSRLIPDGVRAVHDRHVQHFAAGQQAERAPLHGESLQGLRADGQTFPIEVSVCRMELMLDGQRRTGYMAMMSDLSATDGLRSEVTKLSERVRTVLDLTPVAIWIVDDEQVVYGNRAAVQLFGAADREHLIGRSIYTLLHARGHVSLRAHLRLINPNTNAQPTIISGTLLRGDGQTREVDIATSALPDHGQTVLQMVIIDVTESQRQVREQALHRGELRRLAASVVEAREEERRRIARELHDELGQRLTAMKMELSSLRAEAPGHDGSERITGMLEMVDSTVAALRRTAADLRPLMLDDLGLNAAIEWLARDAARRMDIEVTVQLGTEDPPLGPGADIALYRMVQEALTNVGRHAKATDVRIALRHSANEVILTVQDNGPGFPDRSMRQEGRYGLLGMRERAIMLGGRLDLDNPPGGGARITVHLPLKRIGSRKKDLP